LLAVDVAVRLRATTMAAVVVVLVVFFMALLLFREAHTP
jgi:hypothetical protein